MHKHNLSKVICIHEKQKEIILKKQSRLPCTVTSLILCGPLCRFINITVKIINCLIIFLRNR